jgi:hypothetical protein
MKLVKIIQTKYIGPTNFKGSRVKAIDDDKNSVIIEWQSELNSDQNHLRAARALLQKIETKYALNDRETSEMIITGIGSWNGGYMFTAERKLFVKGGN